MTYELKWKVSLKSSLKVTDLGYKPNEWRKANIASVFIKAEKDKLGL